MARRVEGPIALTVLALVVAVPASAQEYRGSILGRVTDTQGGVLPGARVTITNAAMGVSQEVRSNESGNYVAPFLLPGTYAVKVEADAFKVAHRNGIIVQVQSRVSVDFTLELGPVTEVIEIRGTSPLLQKASSDLGQVVDRNMLERLPVAGRSPMELADMAPGVTAGSGDYTSNAQNDITIIGGNGQERGNDITVDGIPNVSARQRGLAVTMPMADAVEEFKVNVTMFDASLGRSNGGALTVTTRRGQNEFKGEVHSYLRDAHLNANSWENNRLGLPRPKGEKYYLLGGTVGGPIKRDRTHFFVGYEKINNTRPITRQARVPTDLERRGDFSQTLNNRGTPLLIYDPLSTALDGGGRFVSRTPFPSSRIPDNRLNPAGRAVLSKYPTPNQAGPNANRIGGINWAGTTTLEILTHNIQARIDHRLNNSNHLYLRFSHLRRDQGPTPNFFPGAFTFPSGGEADIQNDVRRNFSAALNDTITFGRSLVGTFSYGYTRTNINVHADGDELDPLELNLPDSLLRAQRSPAWPQFNVAADNLPSIGSRFRDQVNDVHALMATFNYLRGNHNLRFGSDYRLLRWNEVNPGVQANGQFVFNNRLTRRDPNTDDSTGSAMASLLLGLPNTETNSRIGFASDLSLETHYLALFAQDDWKVGDKLTVNLGLRWELETPFTERYNRLAYGFNPALNLGLGAPGLGPLVGGLEFVGQDGRGRKQGRTDWNNFGPRLGFAWALHDKTVIRGGYGIFYESWAVNISGGNPSTVTTFGAVTPYVGSSDGNVTVLPGVSIGNPFPAGLVEPTGSSRGSLTELGNRIVVPATGRVLPYHQQWQLGFQRELPWQTVLELAYAGTHALKLFENGLQLTEVPFEFRRETNSVPNPFRGILPDTSALGRGNTLAANRLKVAFPQFDRVTVDSVNAGRTIYHGLHAKLGKRLSSGVSFTASYAFGKQLMYEMTSLVNERHYYSVSGSDRPHIFTFYGTADLPLGRGRALGSSWPGWLDTLAGGWALTWVTKYRAGAPLGITDGGGRERPLLIADPNRPGSVHARLGDEVDASGRILNPYLDAAAFQRMPDSFAVSPAQLRYGWIRGPHELTHDLALLKTLRLSGRYKLELRAEINNVTNTPQFDNPGTDINSPQFGVITGAGGARTVRFGAKLRF